MFFDQDKEAQVLAAMLSGEDCKTEGMATLQQEYFYFPLHKTIFAKMKELYLDGKELNPIVICEELGEKIHGKGLAWAILKDPVFFNVSAFKHYITKMQEMYKTRRLQELVEVVKNRISEQENIDDILAAVESEIYAINTNQTEEEKITTPKEHAMSMLETLAIRMEDPAKIGINTSYRKLNHALNGGFKPGQLIILAAKTGRGKTAFAMNIMRDVSVTAKQPSLYVNTEMSKEQMDCRWMTLLTRNSSITHDKIATGRVSDEENKEIINSLENMYTSQFYSVTIPELDTDKLFTVARRFSAQTKMKFMVVDYVGRMETAVKGMQEWQVYKQIAKRLKTLAQELGCTVIMLAQITEDEKLEGAKGMKNEADMFCYLKDELTSSEQVGGANYCLCIDKNRDGRRGKIYLEFIGEKITFREVVQ